MVSRSTLLQAAATAGALAVGVLVYLIDRQPASVYFIPEWISLNNNFGPIFGELGAFLPTFIHVYVFILLTALVLTPPPSKAALICLAWFALECSFEIAQITSIAQWIVGVVPNWFAGIPFLENTSAYFVAGTFDLLDLVSIAAGTAGAYLTIQLCNHRGQRHAS